MSNTIDPQDLAVRLRKLADLFDGAASAPLSVWLSLDVPQYGCELNEPDRIAAVDALANTLGMTAPAAKRVAGSLWHHESALSGDGLRLAVATDITAPAERCACGAVCSHTVSAGAR